MRGEFTSIRKWDGKPIYKYVPKNAWADDYCAGTIYISTLETWRRIEGDQEQGDTGEAKHRLDIVDLELTGSPEQNALLRLGGSPITAAPGVQGVKFHHIQIDSGIQDGWGISFSRARNPRLEQNPNIGPHCIEISNPVGFYEELTQAIVELKTEVTESMSAPILYRERHYSDIAKYPGPHGFVKPRAGYEWQNEMRMLWVTRRRGVLEPFTVRVPGLGRYCRRLPRET